MTVARWEPFRQVVALRSRGNFLFRDLTESQESAADARFVPAVDIY